ncbi:MAG: class I SAM-dependent methyltransferase [Fidelibacterota bacterium]|nr:MAG: class I SAM-dependent methyltransferase [Candidatus Neomarinimicrobiota bacterium]
MKDYYSHSLSAHRLKQCYDLAPPRVQQYLEAEIIHVLERIPGSSIVLELGCGYGRVLRRLVPQPRHAVGIDTSLESLTLAREILRGYPTCRLAAMDAVAMGFCDGQFDAVICIQNGISAFHVDQRQLIAEAVRVTRPGGKVLFSSYSENFWDARLDWFHIQAEHGFVGEIDEAATGEGVIVCKDGFRATTVSDRDFAGLASGLGLEAKISEVDSSSLFCELLVG